MKGFTQIAAVLCMAAAATACAGDREPDTTRTDPPAVGTSGAAANDPARNPGDEANREAARGSADSDFVGDMIANGQAEIMLGKLAQQKARNARVKEFAAMMVRDHAKAGEELKSVASRANVNLANAETEAEDHAELRNRLARLSGAEFDREYMKAMVEQHEQAVDAVESKAEGADNDHVKSWAAKTLPALKKHLEQARQIHDGLGQRSGT
jgi:putative membrane protein